MGELEKLNNIGKELESQLNEVVIYSYDDLVNWGSEEAWLKIKEKDSSSCVNKLMSLEGAIQKIRWHGLSDKNKKHLKNFYENNK